MSQYGRADYWDERYTRDPQPFEWFQKYSALKPWIEKAAPDKSARWLMVGCGNSRVSEDMNDDGYTSIHNIDISNVVITAMRKKCEARHGLTWETMDVMKMSFPDASFDVVFDKGTLDSLLCGENSTANVNRMLSEISRVLKPEGVFILVTYGQPSNRMNYLENADFGWNVSYHTVAKPQTGVSVPAAGDNTDVHYVYICKKGVPPSAPGSAPAQAQASSS